MVGRAVCLGEILIECFAEQAQTPRSEVESWVPLPGGAMANVACALVKLTGGADFVGAVGSDAWGDALLKLLDDMGVGRSGVQRRLKAPTRQVYLLKDDSSDEYTFAGFSESDPASFADAHLFADSLIDRQLSSAAFLVLGTLLLAYPDARQSVNRAVELSQAAQVPIFMDVNWRAPFWPQPKEAPGRVYDLLKSVQYLKVSEDEADWLFGTRSPQVIAKQLPYLKGVLMMAGDGCHYSFQGVDGSVPSFDVDVEDERGASEAFTAGFVHQLMHRGLSCVLDRYAAREAVVYASAVSALTQTRPGAIAALPTAKEVDVFLYLNKPHYSD